MKENSERTAQVRKAGLTVHPVHDRAEDAIEAFRKYADKNGIEIIDLGYDPEPASEEKAKSCQAVVSIGGDGTMLAAVRWAYPLDIPVWGINVGDLGYLTTSGTDDLEKLTGRFAAGEYQVEERTMLEAMVNGGETRLIALNDIVIHRHVPGGGLIMLDAELDGRFLATYEADGLIISTPTGSTGYNMSAGGSILSPDLKAFIITPICAHSFSARSMVVDDSSVLVIRARLKSEGETAYVTADGQEIAKMTNCPLRDKEHIADRYGRCEVEVRKSSRPAGLVRFEEIFFSDVLRDKLGWADSAPNRFNKKQGS